jgi:endonuclease III
MRLEGLTVERIADLLGDTVDETRLMLRKKMRRENSTRETDEETRSLELSRLDFLVNQLMGRIQTDEQDNKAIELLLKCQQRRASLLGTDLGKSEASVSDMSDGDVEKRVKEILKLAPDRSEDFGASDSTDASSSEKLNEIKGVGVAYIQQNECKDSGYDTPPAETSSMKTGV